MLKSFENEWKINDFGLLGRSRKASWLPLLASWGGRGPSWRNLWRPEPIFGRLGPLLARLGGLLGSLGRSLAGMRPFLSF